MSSLPTHQPCYHHWFSSKSHQTREKRPVSVLGARRLDTTARQISGTLGTSRVNVKLYQPAPILPDAAVFRDVTPSASKDKIQDELPP